MIKLKRFFVLLLFFCEFFFLSAHSIRSSAHNFSIDLPEGFKLLNSNNIDRFLFSNSIAPCELQISLDAKKRFISTEKASENIFNQLKASHKDMKFLWCEKQAQLSTCQFSFDVPYSGWVLVLELPESWLTLTAYCKTKDATRCEPMIFSAFDSIYTSQGSSFVPGPITTCLYKRNNPVHESINFNGEKITFFIDKIDMEASNAVVEREFKLLTLYRATPNVLEAWKRYYRNIYRDSWKRLQSFSFAIKNALNKKGVLNDKSEITKIFLKHIQAFSYVRNKNTSDFVDLVMAAVHCLGDCDTRALLMSVVLAQLGVDSVLFVSPEYSHAVSGFNVPGKGARMRVGTIAYLIAETTAKVDLGQIAADIADPTKWFAVELYTLPY